MTGLKKKIITQCEKIAWICMCIVIFDACIFGAGRIITFGPLSFRQLFLLILGVACVPLGISRWKELIKNKFICLLFVFAIWLLFSLVRGKANSNLNVMEDFNGFAYFVFLPLAVIVLNSREKIEKLMRLMIIASLVLALITIGHLGVYLWSKDIFYEMSKYGFALYFSRTGYISEEIPRLYMLSGLYMISGCAFSLYFTAFDNGVKMKKIYYVTPGFCLFALLLSYTRSIYLAVLTAAVVVVIYLLFVLSAKKKRKLLKQLVISAGICLLLCGVFGAISGGRYLQYAFSRSAVSVTDPDIGGNGDGTEGTEPSKDELQDYNEITASSDLRRELTVKESLEYIQKEILLGHGLGFTVPSRPDGNEYSYLDMWLKMGIIGLVLYLLPIVFVIVNIAKTKQTEDVSRAEKIVWLALLLGVMAYSIFNPYINSALGIFIYSCVIAVSQNRVRETEVDDQNLVLHR